MSNVRKRIAGKLFFSGDATIARAFDQGDNFSSPGAGLAASARTNTRRASTRRAFRLTANGSYDVNRAIAVSGVFRARTGSAYSAVGGGTVDFNGDGTFNDRVPGTTRNQFRMPGNNSLDLRFTWTTSLKASRKLQFTVDAFNIYNRYNEATVNTTWGANRSALRLATFGTPLTYFNPREVQLGAALLVLTPGP